MSTALNCQEERMISMSIEERRSRLLDMIADLSADEVEEVIRQYTSQLPLRDISRFPK